MPRREPITEAQTRVLEMLREHKRKGKPMPTQREIADRFGWASVNSAAVKLRVLVKKGYIRMARDKVRAIEVLA